jgi:hypothetical protein
MLPVGWHLTLSGAQTKCVNFLTQPNRHGPYVLALLSN